MPRPEQDPQRLSKRELEVARRITRNQQQQKNCAKRNKIIAGIAAAIGVPAAIFAYTTLNRPRPTNLPEKTPITEQLPLKTQASNDPVLQAEIQRLQIQKSPKEEALWKTMITPNLTLPFNETAIVQAEKYVNEILTFMQQSENPYLRNAARKYYQFKKDGRVDISVGKNPQLNKEGGASTSSRVSAGKIQAHIQLSEAVLLHNGLTLSFLFTHEITHAENILNYDEQLKAEALPLSERSLRHQLRTIDDTIYVQEEARGHGIEVQAFIFEHGLLQYPTDEKRYPFAIKAAQFVTCGSTVDNACWTDYVRREIVK